MRPHELPIAARIVLDALTLCAAICGTASSAFGQNQPLTHYEGHYLAQEPYPNYMSPVDWFPGDHEIQGVANDGENWFFTVVNQGTVFNLFDPTYAILWRIPKEVPLNGAVGGNPGVMSVELGDVPDLDTIGAAHWGDLDYVEYSGVGYLIVPIEEIFACFRADDLSYVNYGNFTSSVAGGWCAVGVDNNLYASTSSPANSIMRYFVDWEGLLFDGVHDVLQEVQEYPLLKSDGTTTLSLTAMQGGEFTSSGELLYLVCGRGSCLGWLGFDGAPWTPPDGIHAIRTDTWTEVQQSVKSSLLSDYFSYDYDPTCTPCFIGDGTDTPEGLTIWDLDDGSAPGIRGSLHVLVDRYMIGSIDCDDKIAFHHYSSKVYVDGSSTLGPGLQGTPSNKFNDVNSAYSYYPIWDGATMVIESGTYDDTGLFNKRIRMESRNGAALIGQQ